MLKRTEIKVNRVNTTGYVILHPILIYLHFFTARGGPHATFFVFVQYSTRHLQSTNSVISGSSPLHRMALVLQPPPPGDLMIFEGFHAQHQREPVAERKHDWPSRTEKRFKCAYEGCDRAYTKPSRLAEHEMTHRNEVRIVCDQLHNLLME